MGVTARILETDSVGLGLAHDSAVLHVQGAAVYIDDMREPDGTLHVEPGYAPKDAHGKIVVLDLDAVRSFPGVAAVLTAKDVPGVNDCSPALGDDPILADGMIEFHGQVVFAVVAETREIARRAARLGKIEIAGRQPAVTVEDALPWARRMFCRICFHAWGCGEGAEGRAHVISKASCGWAGAFYMKASCLRN